MHFKGQVRCKFKSLESKRLNVLEYSGMIKSLCFKTLLSRLIAKLPNQITHNALTTKIFIVN